MVDGTRTVWGIARQSLGPWPQQALAAAEGLHNRVDLRMMPQSTVPRDRLVGTLAPLPKD
jgi:hypothetical protein